MIQQMLRFSLGPVSKLPLPARERVGVRVGDTRIARRLASPLKGRGVLRCDSVLLAFIALSVGSAVGEADGRVRYDGFSQARVILKTDSQLQALDRLGIQILNCSVGVGPLDIIASPKQLEELARLGIDVETRVADIQRAMELQRADDRRRIAALGTGDPFVDFFLDYRPYDGVGGIVWYMNELVARHPGVASMINVGTTLQGRTIWGMRISRGPSGYIPGVLYFGCEHAREWITTTVPTYFANYLLNSYGVDPRVNDLVDHVEFFLVPVLNVDGYEYTRNVDRFWRKNRRDNGNGTFGVDLDRNWGVGWGGTGSSPSTDSLIYRGTTPFSEPETQVLRDFFLAHDNIRAQLDMHSYAQLILWPFGYTPDVSADQTTFSNLGTQMQSLIKDAYGTSFNAGPTYSTIHPASGMSIDWTYAERGIMSMSLELRDTGFYGFDLPADQIVPSNEELIVALLHVADSDWVRAPFRLDFPNGIPDYLIAGQPTVITVSAVPQEETIAPGTLLLHYRPFGTGEFIETPLTSVGGTVFEAVLPPMGCAAAPEFYFSGQGSGGSVVRQPAGAPEENVFLSRMTTGTENFYYEPLNANPGWSLEGQWAWGIPSGAVAESGPPDPTSGYTGSRVFGFNLNGGYSGNLPEQHLTSPPIDCTDRSGLRLSFERWLGVEEPTWDHASVRVSNNGIDWVTVWQNATQIADTAWNHQVFDISFVADHQPTVYLRWTMGPTDSVVAFCGWNIDDIRLTSDVCDSLRGDYDGDGIVGPSDYSVLADCIAHPAPGCEVFDFDGDGDVDCADWSDFRAEWNDPSTPPIPTFCANLIPPTVVGEGPRYVAVTPPPGLSLVALFVTSPDQPCLASYIDVDPDSSLALSKVARLVPSPVFRSSLSWGTLHVRDQRIAPGRRYRVRAEYGGDVVSIYSVGTTFAWADVTEPFGIVNFTDISAVLDRFRDIPQALPKTRCDLQPATPDYIVDFSDVSSAVDAFKGQPYPFAKEADCP